MENQKTQFEIVSKDGVLLKRNKKMKTNKTKQNNVSIKIAIIAFAIILTYSFLSNNVTLATENDYLSGKVEDAIMVSSEEDNIAATANVLVYSQNDKITSSGVVLGTTKDNQLIILTAKHSVEYKDNHKTEVRFIDNSIYVVDKIFLSTEQDFAFLVIDMDKISSDTLKVIKSAKCDENVRYKNGEDVYVIGMHAINGLIYYNGQISNSIINNVLGQFDDSFFELVTNFGVINGTSGGGVYNENGVLLGICSKGTDEYTKFVPIYDILESYMETFE